MTETPEPMVFTGKFYLNGRLWLSPVQEADAMTVALWRNSPSARKAFYNRNVVTPDSHAAWLRSKSPYDLVWMAREASSGKTLGMAGLVVDQRHHTAEAGRFFIAPAYRGGGYGLEIDWMVLSFAFDCLRLEKVWIDAYEENEAILQMHTKAGYARIGVNVYGHLNERGPVVHMAIIAHEWYAVHRARFAETCNVTLPELVE